MIHHHLKLIDADAERATRPQWVPEPDVRCFSATGGVTIMEVRSDGTAGESLVSPEDEATEEFLALRHAQFVEYLRAKHGVSLTLC